MRQGQKAVNYKELRQPCLEFLSGGRENHVLLSKPGRPAPNLITGSINRLIQIEHSSTNQLVNKLNIELWRKSIILILEPSELGGNSRVAGK